MPVEYEASHAALLIARKPQSVIRAFEEVSENDDKFDWSDRETIAVRGKTRLLIIRTHLVSWKSEGTKVGPRTKNVWIVIAPSQLRAVISAMKQVLSNIEESAK